MKEPTHKERILALLSGGEFRSIRDFWDQRPPIRWPNKRLEEIRKVCPSCGRGELLREENPPGDLTGYWRCRVCATSMSKRMGDDGHEEWRLVLMPATVQAPSVSNADSRGQPPPPGGLRRPGPPGMSGTHHQGGGAAPLEGLFAQGGR